MKNPKQLVKRCLKNFLSPELDHRNFYFLKFELVSLVWVNPNKIDSENSRFSKKNRASCALTMRNIFDVVGFVIGIVDQG